MDASDQDVVSPTLNSDGSDSDDLATGHQDEGQTSSNDQTVARSDIDEVRDSKDEKVCVVGSIKEKSLATGHQNQSQTSSNVDTVEISSSSDEECDSQNEEDYVLERGQSLSWKERSSKPIKQKRETTNSIKTRNYKQLSLYFQSENTIQDIQTVQTEEFFIEHEFDVLCFSETLDPRPYCSRRYKVAYFTHKHTESDDVGAAILVRKGMGLNIERNLCFYHSESTKKFQAACVVVNNFTILCVSADSENTYHVNVLNHIFDEIDKKKKTGLIVCGNFGQGISVKANISPVYGESTDAGTILKSDDIFHRNCRVLYRDPKYWIDPKLEAIALKFKR